MSALGTPNYIDYLQVGKGRLGNLIAEHVLRELSNTSKVQFARIDAQAGLTDPDGVPLNAVINCLVICVAPGRSGCWQWHQLLLGMLKQKACGGLKINKLIFVSSTRIYDGIEQGIIAVETPPKAKSERGKQLLMAENQIKQLAKNYHILCCSGLYGGSYQKYWSILSPELDASTMDSSVEASLPHKTSAEITQPRFGVHVDSVAQAVVHRIGLDCSNSSYSLLTDGYCYFEGYKIPVEKVRDFCEKYRLLTPGFLTCID